MKKIVICITIFLILIIGGGAFFVNSILNKVERVEIDRNDVVDTGQEGRIDEDIINIALFGTDKSYTEKTASDAMMVLTINTKTNEIKLCSLMRDILVQIPGHKDDNLNTAIIKGGPQLALKTINTNFNLKIDKFVQVNLGNLYKIIDKLGGVEIEITDDEIQYMNSYIKQMDSWNKTTTTPIQDPGKQLLNGTQASAYARVRYTAGRDFKRTERQRDVLEAIFNKFKNMSPSELPEMIMELLPLVETNMTNGEMISIGSKALKIENKNIQQGRFPEDGDSTAEFVNGYYHMYMDKAATLEKLHKFIYSE